MFENFSYKIKFFALIGLIVILSVTAYKRSFSITIDSYSLLKESEQKLNKIANSQQNIERLTAEISYLDQIMGKDIAHPDLVQQEILSSFIELNKETNLIGLKEVHKAKNNYFNVYSNRLILEGTFENLLQTTYNYERDFDASRIMSLKFYVERQPRTRKKQLFEQIIFQNYEKIPQL